MKNSKDVVISTKELESLAAKLEKFSGELTDDESTMLTAMIILAGKQLEGISSESLRISRDEKQLEGLQAGFASSFSRFAPGAFPDPSVLAPRVSAGTVCIE